MELLTWQNICPQCLVVHYITGISQTLCTWYSHVTRLYLSIAKILPLQPMRKSWNKAELRKWSKGDNIGWICGGVNHVRSLKWLAISTCSPHGLFHKVVMNYDIDSMLLVWHGLYDADNVLTSTPCWFAMDSMTWSIGLRPRVESERSIPWLTTSCRLDVHNTIIHIISSQSKKINFQWIFNITIFIICNVFHHPQFDHRRGDKTVMSLWGDPSRRGQWKTNLNPERSNEHSTGRVNIKQPSSSSPFSLDQLKILTFSDKNAIDWNTNIIWFGNVSEYNNKNCLVFEKQQRIWYLNIIKVSTIWIYSNSKLFAHTPGVRIYKCTDRMDWDGSLGGVGYRASLMICFHFWEMRMLRTESHASMQGDEKVSLR